MATEEKKLYGFGVNDTSLFGAKDGRQLLIGIGSIALGQVLKEMGVK